MTTVPVLAIALALILYIIGFNIMEQYGMGFWIRMLVFMLFWGGGVLIRTLS